jgi:predicted dehydrogenase
MLADQEIDCLSVVTSDDRHADIVIQAAEAGVRGIFCEKPIATTLAEADSMIDAVESRGIPMSVNHTRRWYPEFQEARALIRGGEFGRVNRIIALAGGPRAMLFRNGSHLMDTVMFVAESDPEWVVGELDPGFEDYGPDYAGGGGRDPAKDPGATAMIRFQNGVIAFCSMSKGNPRLFDFEVLCEKAVLRLANGFLEIQTPVDSSQPVFRRLPAKSCMRSDTTAAVGELIDLMENGGVSQCSARDARKTLEVLLGILRSQADGGVRVNFPLS